MLPRNLNPNLNPEIKVEVRRPAVSYASAMKDIRLGIQSKLFSEQILTYEEHEIIEGLVALQMY